MRAWHLRAFDVASSFIQNQDLYYFRGIPRVALYAGNHERDVTKFFDSDRAQERGVLFAARTKDLQNYASIAKAQELPTTQLTPQQYSADLLKHWIELSSNANDESSEAAGEDDSHSQHVGWGPMKGLVVPTTSLKVIDCETSELVDCTTEAGYIALSYVWRLANNDLVPSTHSMDETLHSRSTSKLFLPPLIPRVVHNAMTVVMDLGYRYLWVDQFCIDQSAPKDELIEQISKMDIIYSSAQLTIIAASTLGALPGVGTNPRIPQKVLELGGLAGKTENGVTCFTTNPGIQNGILGSVWHTRGWCFQEAMLSSRRLYFTDHETYFDAENLWCSDSYPEPDFMSSTIIYNIRSDLSLGVQSWGEFLEDREIRNEYELDDPRGVFWVELAIFLGLILEYLEKEMTFDGDVINGFTGVMKVFARQDPNFQNLQGLPVFGLPHHLQFENAESKSTVEGSDESEVYHTLPQEDCKDFRKAAFANVLSWTIWPRGSERVTRRDEFPSWSWAGWKGMPSWDYMPKNIHNDAPDIGEIRFNIQAIESVGGTVVDFDEAPAHFSKTTDDPMFLVGEAVEVPRYRFMKTEAWSGLLNNSKVARYERKASSFYQSCMWLSRKVKQTSWALMQAQPTSPDARMKKLRTLSRVFRLSRLATCFAQDTWSGQYHLDSPEVLGSSPLENDEEEVARRLDDGRWSYLLMSEGPGRADLLIVSWETSSDGERRVYNDSKLRTASRVGVVQILNHSGSGRLFSEDNPDLPTVHLRLG